jgi:hypothetical protein
MDSALVVREKPLSLYAGNKTSPITALNARAISFYNTALKSIFLFTHNIYKIHVIG